MAMAQMSSTKNSRPLSSEMLPPTPSPNGFKDPSNIVAHGSTMVSHNKPRISSLGASLFVDKVASTAQTIRDRHPQPEETHGLEAAHTRDLKGRDDFSTH
jgi:hypothetical protein